MIRPQDVFGIEVQIEPEDATFNEVLDVAIWCDQMGVDAVYVWDHALPLKRGEESFECWTTLGAIAARTFNIKVGSLVSVIPFRTPSLLAYQARTLNAISHGRAVLGVGAGWNKPDFDELEVEWQPLHRRLDQMEASLGFIRERTPGIPLLVGGGGWRAVQMAARYAHIYHSFGEPEVLKERYDLLFQHYLAADRVGGAFIKKSVGLKPKESSRIQEYRDAGVDVFTISVKPSSFGKHLLMDWIEQRDTEWLRRRATTRRSER